MLLCDFAPFRPVEWAGPRACPFRPPLVRLSSRRGGSLASHGTVRVLNGTHVLCTVSPEGPVPIILGTRIMNLGPSSSVLVVVFSLLPVGVASSAPLIGEIHSPNNVPREADLAVTHRSVKLTQSSKHPNRTAASPSALQWISKRFNGHNIGPCIVGT